LDIFIISDDEKYLDKEVKDTVKVLELISNNELGNAMLEKEKFLDTYEKEREEGRKNGRKELEEERKKFLNF